MTVREFYNAWDFEEDEDGFGLNFGTDGYVLLKQDDKAVLEAFGDAVIERIVRHSAYVEVFPKYKEERSLVRAGQPSGKLEVLK